jgi:enoyl-CoA hydratase/carnithine racemase
MTSHIGSCWDAIHESSRDHEVLQVSQPESGIFLVNLNSPDTHNMLNPLLMGALARAVDRLSAMEPENVLLHPPTY